MEPASNAVSALRELTSNPSNLVILVSLNSKKQVHKNYAKHIPNLCLGAENGFFWRWNSIGKTENDWN
jgi:trehalose-6-phosphatase